MAGDYRLITEAWLAANFTPKSGITPGSDSILNMDCTQVLGRYNVTISGSSTGSYRCPSQNEIVSAVTLTTPTTTSYNSANATSNSISVALASGSSVGDIIFLYVAANNGVSLTVPTGYTNIDILTSGGLISWLCYKVVTSGDLGANTTVNASASCNMFVSKISVSYNTTPPNFRTTNGSRYINPYSTPISTLTANAGGAITNSKIICFSAVYHTPTVTESITGGYTYINGINYGNNMLVDISSKTQSSSSTMDPYTVTPNISSYIQIFQVQIPAY